MKTTLALGLGLLGCLGLAAQDRTAPKLEGMYTLVGGKVMGKPVGDESKKAEFTFEADKVVIRGKQIKFEMSYRLDPTADPVKVDMVILEGPEGTKGVRAEGIVEAKDGTVKLAYSVEKDKRPKDFKGESGYFFELKKVK